MTQYQPPLCRRLLQLHRWANSCRAGAVASRSSVSLRQLARVRLRLNSVRPSSCTLRNTLAGSQGGCCSTHLHDQPATSPGCRQHHSNNGERPGMPWLSFIIDPSLLHQNASSSDPTTQPPTGSTRSAATRQAAIPTPWRDFDTDHRCTVLKTQQQQHVPVRSARCWKPGRSASLSCHKHDLRY